VPSRFNLISFRSGLLLKNAGASLAGIFVWIERDCRLLVMAELVPAIHVLGRRRKRTWMPGTRPGMTIDWF
jgi:hypothetical protein